MAGHPHCDKSLGSGATLEIPRKKKDCFVSIFVVVVVAAAAAAVVVAVRRKCKRK